MEEAKKITSPMKAIRAHCKQCVGSFPEIINCGGDNSCPLFDFRLGKNPYRTVRILTDEQRASAIERLQKARETQQKEK